VRDWCHPTKCWCWLSHWTMSGLFPSFRFVCSEAKEILFLQWETNKWNGILWWVWVFFFEISRNWVSYPNSSSKSLLVIFQSWHFSANHHLSMVKWVCVHHAVTLWTMCGCWVHVFHPFNLWIENLGFRCLTGLPLSLVAGFFWSCWALLFFSQVSSFYIRACVCMWVLIYVSHSSFFTSWHFLKCLL